MSCLPISQNVLLLTAMTFFQERLQHTRGKQKWMTRQYRVWPPSFSKHSRTLDRIEPHRRRTVLLGILSHSCCRASANCLTVRGAGWRARTRRPNSSHMCSITFRSGEREGQGKTLIPCWRKKSWVNRAVCGRALSCWNIIGFGWRRISGTSSGRKISST